MPPRSSKKRLRLLACLGFVAVCAAAVVLRHAVVERRFPTTFSYSIESCFRFRYAEMRMAGKPVPDVDPAAQWPEGFDVRRTILPLPDKVTALFHGVSRGGDPYLSSRATIILFSSLAVAAFVALAMALYRSLWAAATATLVYAVSFGAYCRTAGSYLREDFALPGILLATAGAVYLAGGAEGKRRGAALIATALGTAWAGSCWHMAQFSIGVLAALVFVLAMSGKPRAAAHVGAALWLGLIVAGAANTPLRVKGAVWSVTSAAALAPAAGYLLARMAGREKQARRFTLACAAVLAATAALAGQSGEYGHVFALAAAKAANLGIKPDPSRMNFDARLYWVGPYESPGRSNLVLEYGAFGLAAAVGFALLVHDLIRRRAAPPGALFAVAAVPVYSVLYLTWVRMTVFLAPWTAALSVYPALRARSGRARAAWLSLVGGALLVHFNGVEGFWRPAWYGRAVEALAAPPVEVAWFYGSERHSLLRWLADPAREGAVLTDFSFSPWILYLAGRPTALHPMFEVPPEVRKKTLAYVEAAASTEQEFHELCSAWRIRYVIHFAPQVLDRGSGSFHALGGVEPRPGTAAWLMQFEPHRLQRFRLAFETYTTRVFEVGRPYDGFRSPACHPLFDPKVFGKIPSREELAAFYAGLKEAHSLYGRGLSAQAARNWTQALESFTGLVRLHPDYEDVNLRLASCYLGLARPEQARYWLARAGRTNPGDPRLAAYLAVLEKKP